MNKQYEITFLTKEDLKENSISKEIESLDGKIISTSTLGQKQLSYKIKKEKEAYFTTVIFEIAPEKVAELDRKLNLKDEILRHLIVIFKAKETPVKIVKKEETVTEEKEISKKTEEEKPEEKIAEAEIKVEKVKKETKKTKKPEIELGEEERLKALDEKLNELLKE
ncbi:MAG: 30S ribosomal protein S6 [Berkelbacteria bacterium GW2011_GWA1_36_9]|uniref:Small ribosomal subunit protein bS6 n=1 Tax=Berkelbacteria bacterium GW2011_GWA1_36_9 TaxID=1618331 RepID=A0A0G0FLK7_9BACT|nr:MAG: 30S ribosomal protein S6 [Berkelbacteria bacterium GW2011_GWA1_36_9]